MTITADNASSIAELERLKVLHNGTKGKLTFSDAEFERRLGGLRQIMAAKSLDAVILTSYHGIKYYSDFLFTTFGRNYALVVTADDSVTITANIDAGMPWRTSYGENIVYTDWRRDNFYFGLQEALRQRGVKATRLGVEDDFLPGLTREKILPLRIDRAARLLSRSITSVSHAWCSRRRLRSLCASRLFGLECLRASY